MKKWILVTSIVVLILAGVVVWLVATSSALKIAVQNVGVRFSSTGEVEILAELEIANSMIIPLRYFKAGYEINAGGVRIATGEIDVSGNVAAGGKTSVKLPLVIDIGSARQLRQTNADKPMNLDVTGALYFDLKLKKIAIPYHFSREIQPGNCACEVIEVPVQIKDGKVTLSPIFHITGDLPEKTISATARYTVQIADAVVATGNAEIHNVEQTRQRLTGKLSIELDLAMWRDLRRKYAGTAVDLTIAGNVDLLVNDRHVEIPFTFSKLFEVHGRPFSLAVKEVCVKSISRQAIVMEVTLSLTSEIPRDIGDLKAEYEVISRQTQLVQGTLSLPHLPALGQGEARLPLTIERASLKQVKEGNAGKKTPLLIQGQAWAMVNDQKVHVPFSVTKEIEFAEKPFEVKLQKIRVRRLRAPSIVDIAVAVKNATAMNVKDLKIDGKIHIGEGLEVDVLDKLVNLPAGQSAVLNLEVKRERGAIVELLRAMIQERRAGGRCKLKFRGKTEDGAEISADSDEESTVIVEGEN